MLNKKDQKLLFILSIFSIVLSVIVCVPFSLNKISLFEIIIKYFVIALAIIVFTIIGFSLKYRNYRPAIKFTTISTYTPLFSYVVAVLFNSILIIVRNTELYSSAKLNVYLIMLSVLMVSIAFLSHSLYKAILYFTKNQCILLDCIMSAIGIAVLIFAMVISFDYRSVDFLSSSPFYIIIPGLFAILAGLIHGMSIKYLLDSAEEFTLQSRKEIYDKWLENRSMAYEEANEDLLNQMYDFTKEELQIDDTPKEIKVVEKEIVVDNTEINRLKLKIAALEKELSRAKDAINSSKEKIVATLKLASDNDNELALKTLDESLKVVENERKAVQEAKEKLINESEATISSLQAILDEHAAKEAERIAEEAEKAAREALEKAAKEAEKAAREAEREKEIKSITPSFSEFVLFAKSIGADRDDMEVSNNDKQTVYKFSSHGKVFLTIQESSNDYRLSLFVSTDEMRTLLYQYVGLVSFDKSVSYPLSKAEIQQLKVIYKGDESITFDTIKELMNNSLNNLLNAEEEENNAKEAEKARKERAKEAEKALREKERALEKEAREAEKAAQKEQEALEKAAINESNNKPANEKPSEESEEANNTNTPSEEKSNEAA